MLCPQYGRCECIGLAKNVFQKLSKVLKNEKIPLEKNNSVGLLWDIDPLIW